MTAHDRHPQATFTAAGSDFGSMKFSTTPARATDGNFLTENVEEIDILTEAELQTGRWVGEDALDPGTYWVLLHALPDFGACWIFDLAAYNPWCADGYSNMHTLTVPRPTIRYSTSVKVYRYLKEATLSLTADALGDKVPYKVCYKTAARKTRCARDALNGFDWDYSVTDSITVSTRSLAKYTTFTWYAAGTKVASRRVRVR